MSHLGKDERVEVAKPEQAAAAIDVLTDPVPRTLAQAARESGLSHPTVKRLAERLDHEYQPVKRELERVKTDTFVKEFENLGLRSLQSITDEDLKALNAYQRTLVAAIAIDKRELLDGRPTERISVEDRRALPDLMRVLLREAERRGLMKEVNPETNTAHLVARPEATYEVLSGHDRMAPIGEGPED